MESVSSNGSAVFSQRISYEEYLKSDHWLNLRSAALAKAGGKCEVCKRKNNLHGHHLKYRNLFDCTTDDIMALCSECHDSWHGFYSASIELSRDFVLGFLTALRRLGASSKENPPPKPVKHKAATEEISPKMLRKRMRHSRKMSVLGDPEVIRQAKLLDYGEFKLWLRNYFDGRRKKGTLCMYALKAHMALQRK